MFPPFLGELFCGGKNLKVLCHRPFYKIFVKFRNYKKNVLKIALIIVNINKDENKSLISNQLSLKDDVPPISWRTILRR
jgi:hypothetical protein